MAKKRERSIKSERVLILGLGGVGFYLAKRLSHEGHAITAIEQERDLIRRADGEIDARLIRGDAMSFSCWDEAQVQGTEVLIAVTDNDAVNITATLIAHRLGIRRKIARVRSLELWEPDAPLTAKELEIDLVIRPEELAAQEILRVLEMRSGNVSIDIAEGRMQVISTPVHESSPLAHQSIVEVSKRHDDFPFRIVAIARGINTVIPGGDHEILPGDHVFTLAHADHVPRLMEIAGVTQDRSHRVMIVGGGRIGTRVAELLEGDFPVRVLERDERRAEELTYLLGKTECLHGDGSDTDTLIKAGLLDMDTIVTATGDNETNIMTSVLAKHLFRDRRGAKQGGDGKTIALVKREEYLVLASSMGADVVLNRNLLAGNEVLKYLRRGRLLTVAHLHGCDAEVVELVAEPGAPAVGKPLYQVGGTQGKLLIGGVQRDGEWEIAVGSTTIEAGDRVIGISTSRHLPDLQRLLLS